MQRTLYEMVTGYAEATGCTCKIEQGSCHAVLCVEDAEIQIGLLKNSGMLVFQTAVAVLPREDAGREAFCMKLLAANNLFAGTKGFTLGLDTDQQLVTLQLAWDIYHLNAEGFDCIVNNLLAVTAEWITCLNDWHPSCNCEGEGSSERDLFNLLKV